MSPARSLSIGALVIIAPVIDTFSVDEMSTWGTGAFVTLALIDANGVRSTGVVTTRTLIFVTCWRTGTVEHAGSINADTSKILALINAVGIFTTSAVVR